MTQDIQSNPTQTALIKPYAPSEVIGIFSQYLATKGNGRITVRGEYLKTGNKSYAGYFYDELVDQMNDQQLSLKMPAILREDLEAGKIIEVYGLIERRTQRDCSVKLCLCVSGINDIQEKEISEEDLRRVEIRRKKGDNGYKKVDTVLESIIFADKRPSVALLYAESSITDSDFAQGKESAESAVDFHEYRVSFARPANFVARLQEIDGNGHDIMCIVRGGGSGLEALENLDVLDCVAGLKTPVISAVGHVEDKVFINEISDLEIGTPSLLGSWFQNHVESIAKKKADSTAALTKKIEGQFKEQLATSKKQNEELQKKFDELNKTSTEAQKLHDKQVQDAAKLHKEQMDGLQKKIAEMTKASTDAQQLHDKQVKEAAEQHKANMEGLQKKIAELTKASQDSQKLHDEQVKAAAAQHKTQMETLQGQLKTLTESNSKQAKDFNEQLGKMQENAGKLNESISKLTAENTASMKALAAEKEKNAELQNAMGQRKTSPVVYIMAVLIVILTILLILKF